MSRATTLTFLLKRHAWYSGVSPSSVCAFTSAPLRSRALYEDPGATLDDLLESVATLEDSERIARRVLGGVHPLTSAIEDELRNARTALRARETPPPGSS